ncbi:MAG: SpoIVB peptidase [Clostridia bacterium]|nr:SpoIVB peptidase [Clostridia bacterium]
MRWLFQILSILLIPICAGLFLCVFVAQRYLPESFRVNEGEGLMLPVSALSAAVSGDQAATAAALRAGSDYEAEIRLFGIFPVGTVSVNVEKETSVAVCGTPFGIKMFTDGVLVVGLADVDARTGAESPARKCGIRVGDTILSIDGAEVSQTDEVASLIESSASRPLALHMRRGQIEYDVQLTALASVSEKRLKAGMWIRDSSAGIGTLTFTTGKNGVFAGLGHPISDVDTGETMPIATGEIVPASIFGVTKGAVGAPGELKGSFDAGSYGVLTANGDTGLYGVLTDDPPSLATIPIAHKQEIVEGDAELITTIHGSTPKRYRVCVEQVDLRGDSPTRHMVIRITDETLLAETGGIVQGMSGSPIIQNGKLIGAVTHVLVGDPTGGYAIFAETMLESAKAVPASRQNTAA